MNKRRIRTSGITLSGRRRERWRQEWMEGGLAGVDRGMLPDQCKEGGVGQVSHQLQPWPSSLLLSLSHTLSAPFNHRSQPLVLPWSLSPYKSISSTSNPPRSFRSPPPSPALLPLSPFLLTRLPPFIVGSAVGVERSGVGRREWGNRAEAMNECKNERMSVFNQSVVEQGIWGGTDNISRAFPTTIISAEGECGSRCVATSTLSLLS